MLLRICKTNAYEQSQRTIGMNNYLPRYCVLLPIAIEPGFNSVVQLEKSHGSRKRHLKNKNTLPEAFA